jgi:hypothetical protein
MDCLHNDLACTINKWWDPSCHSFLDNGERTLANKTHHEGAPAMAKKELEPLALRNKDITNNPALPITSARSSSLGGGWKNNNKKKKKKKNNNLKRPWWKWPNLRT